MTKYYFPSTPIRNKQSERNDLKEADLTRLLSLVSTAGLLAAWVEARSGRMRPGTSRTCLLHYASERELVSRDTFVAYIKKLAATNKQDCYELMTLAKRVCRAFCDSYNHSEGILLSKRIRGVHPLAEFEQWYGPNPGYYVTKEEVAEYLMSELKRREAAHSSRAKRQPIRGKHLAATAG